MAIASKRVLVVGPQDGLAAAVARELDAGNTPVTFVADHTIHWDHPGSIEKLFGQQKPRLLLHEINFRDPSLLDPQASEKRAALLERSRALAEACVRHECRVMHLSDYHVFGGDTKNAYDERDPPAPLDSYGALIAELEQEFAGRVDKHMILRFSWLVDVEGNNLFTRILSALTRGEQLVLSPYHRGAPTWYGDARRVIHGVARQVMAGAENWGFFHYCSADSCNEWEFGREVEATLAEVSVPEGKVLSEDEKVSENKKDSHRYPHEPASATLNSRRIRDNFGVHGRSWRQGLKGQVSQWLERQGAPEAARSSAGR